MRGVNLLMPLGSLGEITAILEVIIITYEIFRWLARKGELAVGPRTASQGSFRSNQERKIILYLAAGEGFVLRGATPVQDFFCLGVRLQEMMGNVFEEEMQNRPAVVLLFTDVKKGADGR